MIPILFAFAMASFGLVTPLGNGEYQIPDNWSGCFVNPDDLNDQTFGCSGPVGGPDDSKIKPNVSKITITMSNGTVINMSVFANGTVLVD